MFNISHFLHVSIQDEDRYCTVYPNSGIYTPVSKAFVSHISITKQFLNAIYKVIEHMQPRDSCSQYRKSNRRVPQL